MHRRIAWTVLLLVSLAAVAWLSEPPRQRRRGPHEVPLLPRAEVIQVFAAPALHLFVDYLWIRTTHAVGSAVTSEEHRDIYLWADLLTDLDPDFRQVYIFAGAAIPVNLGRGEWANTRESTQILEKGLEELPEGYFLRILLAWNLVNFHQEYARAARLIEEASKMPGAPEYLGPLATRLYARAGDFDVGLELAQSLAQSAEDPESRQLFEQRALQLQLEKELVRVDQAVERYRGREGQLPRSLEVLLRAGDLDRPPEDPLGGIVYLDSEGKARSTAEDRRLSEFPTERP